MSWLQGLNPEQSEAARHDYGPLLILAGAGSGKTTVLVSRAGRLVDHGIVEPSKLCVLTFTNKAARELKSRVAAKLGDKIAKHIWAGTFHSFGLWLLRCHYREARLPKEFGILDSGDAGHLVKELVRDFNNSGKSAYDADTLLEKISELRESGRTEARTSDEYEVAAEWLLPRYLKRLESLGMVDFDGLILRPIELMKANPEVRDAIRARFDQVMVDEFQDTNAMQMRFIRELVDGHRNITVVGDDDQSIYGWRGACVSNILDFPKMYDNTKVVRLERNYRSTPVILDLANEIISKNKNRHAKVLRAASATDTGELPELFVYETENEEAESVAAEISGLVRQGTRPVDIAVLYRSNGQGALIEAELRRLGIPYAMSGGTAFFDRKEIRDCLAYLRCAIKPNDVSFRRILNTPPRGIGDKTIEHLNDLCTQQHVNFLAASRRWREAGVDEKAGAAIESVWQLLGGIVPSIVNGPGPAGERLMAILQEMGYRAYLDKNANDAAVAAKRWRSLETFTGILDRFLATGGRKEESVKEFVDAMELRDTLEDKLDKTEKVQLLTLHACKGLEWPTVFLIGVEEDLLPHRTLGSDIAEERRLFYVGVTRARKRLILTRAKKRKRHGRWADSPPSRFLLELRDGLYKEYAGSRPVNEEGRRNLVADLFKKLDGPGKWG